MTDHPTDQQIDEAIKKLKGVIEAAQNSNHSGEVALMKAVGALTRGDDAFPPWGLAGGGPGVPFGGPAFPTNPVENFTSEGGSFYQAGSDGMTLRQYYAGQALIGYIMTLPRDSLGFGAGTYDELAEKCYRAADAMIAQGAKP